MNKTNELNISPIILDILSKRGIRSQSDIEEYISPKPRKTYDPFLMKGMDEISDHVINYARAKRKICVYGDYDADGVTSVSLMMTVLRELDADVWYYIPSRFEEGYGLNFKAIDKIAKRQTELIITVDNGCVALDEVEYIKQKGMSVIITDHHNLEAQVPECLMLNPKQVDDKYPFNFLCGCGVAFKLAQAIIRKTNMPKRVLNNLLDIVSIATIGDIVPLIDENRTLVKYGIDRIHRNIRPGLRCLLDATGINASEVNSYKVAFGIVPYINSCGRMETADMGVELLTCGDMHRDEKIAADMKRLNTTRRNLQEEIYKGITECLKKDTSIRQKKGQPSLPNIIFHYAGDVHEGVTGIVAGKLKEKYYRPSIILTDSGDGIVKGTGRSIPGIDIHALLSPYDGLFLRFGGHAGACGFSMKYKDIDYLGKSLNADLDAMHERNPDLFDYKLIPDAVINVDEVTLDLARDIQKMEPFGEGNARPIFSIKNVPVKSVKRIGNKGQYKKLTCIGAGGQTFDAISFNDDLDELDKIKPGACVELIGTIDENIWNGKSSVQVILKNIKILYG